MPKFLHPPVVVLVEYDRRRVRVVKKFTDARAARRFYSQKDKAGKHPKVIDASIESENNPVSILKIDGAEFEFRYVDEKGYLWFGPDPVMSKRLNGVSRELFRRLGPADGFPCGVVFYKIQEIFDAEVIVDDWKAPDREEVY